MGSYVIVQLLLAYLLLPIVISKPAYPRDPNNLSGDDWDPIELAPFTNNGSSVRIPDFMTIDLLYREPDFTNMPRLSDDAIELFNRPVPLTAESKALYGRYLTMEKLKGSLFAISKPTDKHSQTWMSNSTGPDLSHRDYGQPMPIPMASTQSDTQQTPAFNGPPSQDWDLSGPSSLHWSLRSSHVVATSFRATCLEVDPRHKWVCRIWPSSSRHQQRRTGTTTGFDTKQSAPRSSWPTANWPTPLFERFSPSRRRFFGLSSTWSRIISGMRPLCPFLNR